MGSSAQGKEVRAEVAEAREVCCLGSKICVPEASDMGLDEGLVHGFRRWGCEHLNGVWKRVLGTCLT